MDKKRYQVFVSSTFTDLIEERRSIIQTLMEMDCIPAGMELFPAMDEEQFEFIKKIIDDCDYYIVVIGARYGSVTADGLSYTELEYDYAKKNELPVIALIHGKPDDLPVGRADIEPNLRESLAAFREKLKANRIVRFWSDIRDLRAEVAISLPKTIKTFPAVGWIRGDTAASADVLAQINKLRNEKEILEQEVIHLKASNVDVIDDLSKDNEKIDITILATNDRYPEISMSAVSSSWNEIFGLIGPDLFTQKSEGSVSGRLACYLAQVHRMNVENLARLRISTQLLFTIRLQFIALGYIEAKPLTGHAVSDIHWEITERGKKKLFALRVVKRETDDALT